MITEPEFVTQLRETLADPVYATVASVTGPGRSGAMASIYASQLLDIEYVPCGREPRTGGPILLIDVADTTMYGLNKLAKRYKDYDQVLCLVFEVEKSVPMWFELSKASVRIFAPPAVTCQHRPMQHFCSNCGAL